ncbi:MAG: hypothetical protein IJ424_08585 [Oscillospiraceae bacterium]|nr:hypothetical protein [Oscillospiraceae bacterium]
MTAYSRQPKMALGASRLVRKRTAIFQRLIFVAFLKFVFIPQTAFFRKWDTAIAGSKFAISDDCLQPATKNGSRRESPRAQAHRHFSKIDICGFSLVWFYTANSILP